MGRKVFTVANGILAVMFLISAVLQYDDPDPLRWAALYIAAAAACVLTGRVRRGWWLAVGVGVISLAWAVALSPILPEVRLGDLARSMKAEKPTIELGRELLGLVIVFVWMAVLVLVSRRDRRAS
jgi:hypothetical protein